MNKKNQSKEITCSIKGIEILDFCLIMPTEPLPEEIKIFNFGINTEQKINFENKLVYNIVTVEILLEDNITKLGSLKSNIIFEITNFSDYSDTKNQTFNLPDDLSMVLNSVSISTTRGLMFSQFKGTFLHNAHLPIIDPKQMKKHQ